MTAPWGESALPPVLPGQLSFDDLEREQDDGGGGDAPPEDVA